MGSVRKCVIHGFAERSAYSPLVGVPQVAPFFTFPVFFMVLYDFPRDRKFIYQLFLTVSTWMWAFYLLLVMYMCAYYGHRKALFSCGSKDFLATF